MAQAETYPSHTTSEWKSQDSCLGLLNTNLQLFSLNPAASRVCVAFWRGLWQSLPVRRTFPSLPGGGQAPGPLFLLGEASFLLARAK